ncbi:MAG: hypothetical protein A4E30_00496 [Methanomassiliicoccales archaeon PtaB.Bin215]|nr:MAG: hypothetical protein A4E30_00496 [Methanomassiliicoccales archaeon PtaB.Bin215]
MVASPSFEDADRKPGTTYYYSITAINEAGEGLDAPIVSASIPRASLTDSGYELLTVAGISIVGATGIVLLVRMNKGSQKKGT